MSIEFGAKAISGMGADLKRMRDAAASAAMRPPLAQFTPEQQAAIADVEAEQQAAVAKALEQVRLARMSNASSMEIVSLFHESVISLKETRWFLGIGPKPETLE